MAFGRHCSVDGFVLWYLWVINNGFSEIYTKSQRIKRTTFFDCFSHYADTKKYGYVEI